MKVKSRRQYSAEFKRAAVVASINSPETLQSVADRLRVNAKTLSRWRAEMTATRPKPEFLVKNEGPDKSLSELERENRKLKKQLERAKLENEILKKATEYFDKLPK